MVELKQVLKVKCEGRERHLGQTATGKRKAKGYVYCGWEVQLCTVKQNLTSLDRHGTSPDAAHSSPTLQKPLLDFNGNTSLGRLLFCTNKKMNYKRDTERAKARQWPNNGLRSF